MKNPGLPDDQQERHHPDIAPDVKPPSETNIKIIKRTSLAWLTITVCGLILAGLVALGNVQINNALVKYETILAAQQREKDLQAQINQLQSQYSVHAGEVEGLKHTINDMDKKLDHITFTLEWIQQHQPRVGTPKDQP